MAIHQLIVQVEKVPDQRELAMGVFLDTEGAYNYISFDSVCTALCSQGVNSTIVQWIGATLEGCLATATLNDVSMIVAVSMGCPQGGVLSPLLWCRVVNDLEQGSVWAGYIVKAMLLTFVCWQQGNPEHGVGAHAEGSSHCRDMVWQGWLVG
jgi:hypothetical protein